MVYIGSDHKGYDLKDSIIKEFIRNNIPYTDCGDGEFNPHDDYPDYAFIVGEKVVNHKKEDKQIIEDLILTMGLLICGSGEGMAIAANKVKGIRATLCHTEESTRLSREHNDANVLVLDSHLDLDTAIEFIDIFLTTPFSEEERHVRRIKKISEYENKHIK